MKLHGGNIGVYSEGEGCGSTFYIDIPITKIKHHLSLSTKNNEANVRQDVHLRRFISNMALGRTLSPNNSSPDLETGGQSSGERFGGEDGLHITPPPINMQFMSTLRRLFLSVFSSADSSVSCRSSIYQQAGGVAPNGNTTTAGIINSSSVRKSSQRVAPQSKRITPDVEEGTLLSQCNPTDHTASQLAHLNVGLATLQPTEESDHAQTEDLEHMEAQAHPLLETPRKQIAESGSDVHVTLHHAPYKLASSLPSTTEGQDTDVDCLCPNTNRHSRHHHHSNTLTTSSSSTHHTILPNNANSHKQIWSCLLVDDSAVNRKMLKRSLADCFSLIEEANNGLECVDKVVASMQLTADGSIRGQGYDLIITDYIMPECHGIEAVRRLRGPDVGYRGKIIGLTGATETAVIDEFHHAGADMVLTKPFQSDDLHAIIQRKFFYLLCDLN